MTVKEFEKKVWGKEGIRIIVRAPVDAEVDDYNHSNRTRETVTVKALRDGKLHDCLGEYEVAVIGTNGGPVHGRTLLRTLRASYNHQE